MKPLKFSGYKASKGTSTNSNFPETFSHDSFDLIKQSRAEILRKLSVSTPNDRLRSQPSIPHIVHLTAIDPKRRKIASQLSASPVKYVHRSILSGHELNPIPDKPKMSSQKQSSSQSKDDQHEFNLNKKRGKSMDNFRPRKRVESSGDNDIEKVKEEVKKRRTREQETDKILDEIITGNTTFEDIFSKQQHARHQQIISAIPAGLNFPTPKSSNVPSPITGRFNNNNFPVDEDEKGGIQYSVNTIKQEQLPVIHESVIKSARSQNCQNLPVPQQLPINAEDIEINCENNKKKPVFFLNIKNGIGIDMVLL